MQLREPMEELVQRDGSLLCVGMEQILDHLSKMVGQDIREDLDQPPIRAISGGAWRIYIRSPALENGTCYSC